MVFAVVTGGVDGLMETKAVDKADSRKLATSESNLPGEIIL